MRESSSLDTPPAREWVSRYSDFLNVPPEAPSFAALARLTRAHIQAVPFENITSLLRRRAHGTPVPALDPDAVLSAWEAGRSGGVCFEAAPMFQRLLAALGYDAKLVLNRGERWDGNHQAVLVDLDGGRFLLDVGNGSPHFDPIPLDGPTEVRHAGLAYRFRPGDAPEEWIQDRWIGEQWTPFFTYILRPGEAGRRQAVFQRHHVPGESFVVSSLTLVKSEPHQVLQLRNYQFTRHTDAGKERIAVTRPEEYERLVAEEFRMPGLPTAAGVTAWLELARNLPEPWTPRLPD